jgi:hypothetical protein
MTPANRLVLAHRFFSEVVLARVLWPEGYAADPTTKAGRAGLYSLAYALSRAASVFLQVEPSELAVGVQPHLQRDEFGAISFGGDLYLYDTLPGGAGYAREIEANFEDIVRVAEEVVDACPGGCEAACYRCLLDYGNQRHHGLIDRFLARDICRYFLHGALPSLSRSEEVLLLRRLDAFSTSEAAIAHREDDHLGAYAAITLTDGRFAIVKPIHSLESGQRQRMAIASKTGHTEIIAAAAIELSRQPFGVWTRAIEASR